MSWWWQVASGRHTGTWQRRRWTGRSSPATSSPQTSAAPRACCWTVPTAGPQLSSSASCRTLGWRTRWELGPEACALLPLLVLSSWSTIVLVFQLHELFFTRYNSHAPTFEVVSFLPQHLKCCYRLIWLQWLVVAFWYLFWVGVGGGSFFFFFFFNPIIALYLISLLHLLFL